MTGAELTAPPVSLIAALADRYRLERELGGGGMSRVWVATENALGRKVVIKVVMPELAEGLSAERFAREVKLAARLQHANIVPVLAAGEAGGLPFYTMPYVRGESLRARLGSGAPVPLAECVSILRDVARALACAHDEGIVHRDIKPDNVLLSHGTAMVADFGIAKAVSASRTSEGSATGEGLTMVGSTVGTPAYMAPEQAAGGETDHRADIYAWGMLGWELLAGRHPFAGKNTPRELVLAHITQMPQPVSVARPDTPQQLASLVMRCLEKDPAMRPQDSAELLGALDSITTPAPLPPRSLESPSTGAWLAARRPGRLAAVALAAIVLGIAGFLAIAGREASGGGATTQTGSPNASLNSIAVLPFVNTGGDARDEYFSDGMTDELAHSLSKLPGLRIAGRSSSFAYKGRTVTPKEIGEALDVSAIVEGTVRRSGDRLRVTAQLTSTRDGHVLWSDGFERAGSDVFAVQDAFTAAIVGALAPLLGGAPPARPGGQDLRGTADAEAYDLYLRGRYYWAQRGADPLDSAVSLFERSVQRDPRFARGWAGLALANVMRPNFNVLVPALPAMQMAEAAARRALSIDSTVADAYTTIGMVHLRRFELEAAGSAFAAARALEPQNATAQHWSALYFSVIGDTTEADAAINLALALDPVSATTINSRGTMWSDRRRFTEALAAFDRVAGINRGFPGIFGNGARALVFTGRADSALANARRAEARSRGRWANLLLAAASAKEWDEARQLRTIIETGGPTILVYDRAVSELVFGSRSRAASLFVESFESEGTIANVSFSLCDPILDPIQDEPVFIAFRERHRIGRCPYSSPWPVGSPAPSDQRARSEAGSR